MKQDKTIDDEIDSSDDWFNYETHKQWKLDKPTEVYNTKLNIVIEDPHENKTIKKIDLIVWILQTKSNSANSGGKSPSTKLRILGRERKIYKDGRKSYIIYNKQHISLTEARKLDKQKQVKAKKASVSKRSVSKKSRV